MFAVIFNNAHFALGRTRRADKPSVIDKSVAEFKLLVGRNNFFQIRLNFFGRFVFGQTGSARKAHAVGVDDDRGFFEDIAQDEICCFSASAGERQKFFHGIRNGGIVVFDKAAAAHNYVFRLVAVKSDGTDIAAEFVVIGARKALNVGIFFE